MSKKLIGSYSSNQHENDAFYVANAGTARIEYGTSDSNEVKVIIDKDDPSLNLNWMREDGDVGSSSSIPSWIRSMEQAGHEGDDEAPQKGFIRFNDSDGKQSGFAFKLDAGSFDTNKNGDLVITATLRSDKATDADEAYFDEDDIYGEKRLALHAKHLKEQPIGSELIREVNFVTDTYSNRDWVDAAQDSYYSIMKDVAERMYTEYGDKILEKLEPRPQSQNALMARFESDINLDKRTEFDLWGGIKWVANKAYTEVLQPIRNGIQKAAEIVGAGFKEYVIDPLVQKETWEKAKPAWEAGLQFSDKIFRDMFSAMQNPLGFLKKAIPIAPDIGNTSGSGSANLANLFGKDWTAGSSNVNLKLSADVLTNAYFSGSPSPYDLASGDIGSVTFELAVPISAVLKGSVGPNDPIQIPVLDPVVVDGPSKTFTNPQSGGTAGGQVSTKATYELDALIYTNGGSSFEVKGGITPTITLVANKDGVTGSAEIRNKSFNKSYSNDFDSITGAGLRANVTPEFEFSSGLYVPEYVIGFGGKKIATIGSTITLPLTFGVNKSLTGSAEAVFSAGADYSIDGKFLEVTSDLGLHRPIVYNITDGTIAKWETTAAMI